MTAGLVVLAAPDAEWLAEALAAPVERAGYRLEPALVEIVAALARARAPLPLLQLAASHGAWWTRSRPPAAPPTA